MELTKRVDVEIQIRNLQTHARHHVCVHVCAIDCLFALYADEIRFQTKCAPFPRVRDAGDAVHARWVWKHLRVLHSRVCVGDGNDVYTNTNIRQHTLGMTSKARVMVI